MSYQVLARKWRPKNFLEVAGQTHAVQALMHALENSRLHHAYLFTGTRGVGKTTLARIIAKSLNCEKGVSANPCDECPTCIAIGQGQSFDVLEIDAASRTRVEDTRELLDNVIYKPAQARYKIYIIDEVHMLSNHSFNALLKTLEEPPPHAIFILATTDPEKLPMTILSRCLQFHLKPLNEQTIQAQLEKILKAENIVYENSALASLALAANGSLRDALSLLDQAIAYGNGKVLAEHVISMLGITPENALLDILSAIQNKAGETLFNLVDKLADDGRDFSRMLMDLSGLLHEIALLQIVPNISFAENRKNHLKPFAEAFSPDLVQLYYQIALIGQRDLIYAPSMKKGFEMALLRMLAFDLANENKIEKTQPTATAMPKTRATEIKNQPLNTQSENTTDDWEKLLPKLNLSGMTLQLARHCAFKSFENNCYELQLDAKQAPLSNEKSRERLQTALSDYYKKSIQLKIGLSENLSTSPHAREEMTKTHKKEKAHKELLHDDQLQAVLSTFNTQLQPGQIETKE